MVRLFSLPTPYFAHRVRSIYSFPHLYTPCAPGEGVRQPLRGQDIVSGDQQARRNLDALAQLYSPSSVKRMPRRNRDWRGELVTVRPTCGLVCLSLEERLRLRAQRRDAVNSHILEASLQNAKLDEKEVGYVVRWLGYALDSFQLDNLFLETYKREEVHEVSTPAGKVEKRKSTSQAALRSWKKAFVDYVPKRGNTGVYKVRGDWSLGRGVRADMV